MYIGYKAMTGLKNPDLQDQVDEIDQRAGIHFEKQ